MQAASGGLEIGLINNMPVGAYKATSRQFRDLLQRAAGSTPVTLRLFSLSNWAGVSDESAHPDLNYASIDAIFDTGMDALIFTGTEPVAADIREEAYWPRISALFDWAQANGVPAICSCLAAHAAVLHLDGIARQPLSEKCFGVFDERVCADNPLIRGLTGTFRIPHSRWNGLSAVELASAGYQILTASSDGGVDLFVRRGRNLLVCFQGHPEYEADRLLLEYRRDTRRFLAGERSSYPTIPRGYFDPRTETILTEFQHSVIQLEQERSALDFPAEIIVPFAAPWRVPAEQVFRNWLNLVRERGA